MENSGDTGVVPWIGQKSGRAASSISLMTRAPGGTDSVGSKIFRSHVKMFTAPETQKVPDQVDFFAGLPYNRLISESVEDEAGIRTIMNEAEGRLSPGEDALRLIIDTTPTLIHTARPDGLHRLLQQRLARILRQSVGGRSRVALD